MTNKLFLQIGIIGGGAAGMMAAATLLESDLACQVHLFDKNKSLGTKVVISGGGRCNLTTGLINKQQLLKKYSRGGGFLKAALSKFSPQKTYEWFEDHGVPLKTEDDLRVFPKSNNGHDVVNVFENFFKKQGVGLPQPGTMVEGAQLHLLSSVTEISKIKDKFIIKTAKESYHVDVVLLATGGNAYRHTGSTGDGYAFATTLGHTITKLGPSLNSFVLKESWPKEIMGISLPNALLKYKKVAVTGSLLFTHFGISGPVTFSLSSQLAFETISPQSLVQVQLIPDASKKFEDWEELFLQASSKEGKKQINTYLQTFFAKRLVEIFLKLAKVSPNQQLMKLSKTERKSLNHLLSGGLVVTLKQRRPGDEFVTAGGVSTDEINPQTMESLIIPNFYLAGEVMNIDGVTGGYNLQASWATGRLAGKSIIKKIKSKVL